MHREVVCLFVSFMVVIISRRSDYVALMTGIQAAQDRARPMIERYQTLVSTDPTLSVSWSIPCLSKLSSTTRWG